MSMVQIQIAGNTYNSQSVGFKDVLKQAYEGRERPLCLCTAKRPELYIAKINDGYFLKRMPGTGIEHDAECPHFEISPLLSGRGNLEASAITHDLTSNTTLLKLGFPLSTHIGSSRGAPPPGSNKATQEVASVPDRKLNLRSLLDLIYEDAHLNRWYPAMEGKRFWGIVAREIAGATKPLRTSRSSLSSSFMIPKYAKRGEYGGNNASCAAFIDQLAGKGSKRPNGFVIGEIHSIHTDYNRPRLVLQFMDTAIELDPTVYTKFSAVFEEELALNEGNNDVHLLVIVCVHNEMSRLVANQMTAMLLDEHWIPVGQSATEVLLLESMHNQKRAFQRILRYTAPPEQVMATAILLDTVEPTPIFIAPAPEDEDEAKQYVSLVKNEAPDAVIIYPGSTFELPPKRTQQSN
ncbi:DUF1173 family protein [Marinobacterium lutimaris]|uniref:DUF1173 domain-containing protein n=1 Tax=Marinobacterium lutimaris TaxID=568106 RepID=A0A1H6DS40_9GAMM|nr:DUF1173 family protein [Marinobacterium lutimaris]SEG88089.1 Protein of unknown function [Marinobacterium lutimaris]